MSQQLAEAVQHHRAGRLREAEALYRRVLQHDPGNAEAHHLLGLLAHQAGDRRYAIQSLRRAIAADDRRAIYRFNLGVVLNAAGQSEAAMESYRAALALDPAMADAHNNLGLLHLAHGDKTAAADCFAAAARHDAEHGEAQVNLGKVLIDLGRPAEALPRFRRAQALRPDLAEAVFGEGRCLEAAGEWAAAEAAYRRALALRPELTAASNNLATVLLAQGRYAEAQAAFRALLAARRGLGLSREEAEAAAPTAQDAAEATAGPRLITSRFALRDRAEQIEYLIEDGALDPAFAPLAARCRTVLAELGGEDAPAGRLELTPWQSAFLRGFYDRVLRFEDAPRYAGPAVNPDLDFAALEDAFLADAAPAVCFDDFLTPEALAGLRRFCRRSTIFFGADPADYVTAYLTDGFNCSLLYQIAEELKARFPRVIGPRFLSNMWAYRHAAAARGVDAHTDYAAATFNFWITDDAANLAPGRGGLLLYKVEEPLDWDWMEVNRRKNDPDIQAQVADFLGPAEPVTLAYRSNRAVLFASKLFHKSDEIRFAEGFANRRVNVTMLFGQWGDLHGRPAA